MQRGAHFIPSWVNVCNVNIMIFGHWSARSSLSACKNLLKIRINSQEKIIKIVQNLLKIWVFSNWQWLVIKRRSLWDCKGFKLPSATDLTFKNTSVLFFLLPKPKRILVRFTSSYFYQILDSLPFYEIF